MALSMTLKPTNAGVCGQAELSRERRASGRQGVCQSYSALCSSSLFWFFFVVVVFTFSLTPVHTSPSPTGSFSLTTKAKLCALGVGTPFHSRRGTCVVAQSMKILMIHLVDLILSLLLLSSNVFGFVTPPSPAMASKSLAASLAPDASPKEVNGDDAYQPYRGKQPSDALSEIFIPRAMPLHVDEELLWVPQTDCVSFRPLCLCVSGGYYVNLLRVRGTGVLSRHRHPGPVHGHVLKGRWRYLEHDWIASEGSYVFEPPGEIHTLVVPEGVDEMITLFHVTGSLLYCDVDGNVVGADDVFTKLELAKKHYASVGLGEDFVQQFIR